MVDFPLLALLLLATPRDSSILLQPTSLRCEYRIDPIGVDVQHPRLSWILESPRGSRGKRQTAYQILVGSNLEAIETERGDIWDTGKLVSDESVAVEYQGKALESGTRYFWQVRVWDENDRLSPWSAVASWTTGLLVRSDWAAEWIADPETYVSPQMEAESLRGANSGYRAALARSSDTEKWVGVDLGEVMPVDGIRLFPATSYDWQEGAPSYYFPLRYRIEASRAQDFSGAAVVVDKTASNQPGPDIGVDPLVFTFPSVLARYVRIVVTRMWAENELFANFALAEMEVLSRGRNVALGKRVTASDSQEVPGWARAFLVDGVTRTVRRTEVQQPAAMLRKSFRLEGTIRHALVHVTARGLYELRINGRRIGGHLLAPEWTDYHVRSQYQAFDVAQYLRPGENVAGVQLAAGWFSGRVGLMPSRRVYGDVPQLLFHLKVEYEDGRKQTVVSDGSWRRTAEGPIRSADIYDGETYDARREIRGWDLPGFDDRSWKPVQVVSPISTEELTWQRNEPIRMFTELKPIAITELHPKVYVFDMGQNMAGWVKLRVQGPAGTVIKVRHAEVLSSNGELYTANLRDAWQIDRYILRGAGEEIFEPHFTYHGFRYVEVSGLPQPPTQETVTGRVFYSAAPSGGSFSSSSAFLNQLMQNIVWTQRGNMQGIQTDCPQRAERLGWTGDLQTFAQAAIYNMDMAAFYEKVLRDMRDEQLPTGRFADVAPNPMKAALRIDPAFQQDMLYGSPGWADAGVTVPWQLYVNYGDRRFLAEHYAAAKAWVDYVAGRNPHSLWLNDRGLDIGDWLNADTILGGPDWPRTGASTPREVFSTAFFAHSADLLSRMAAVLGKPDDAERYHSLFENIRGAFRRAYVTPDGKIKGDTQAGYALALHFNLLPQALRPVATEHLLSAIRNYNGGHISAGIHAAHRLMLELSRNGYHEEAYRLLNQRGLPSWALPIDCSATTIWERWDGYVPGRGFQFPAMNSFNHVAFGAVGEWVWRNVVGLNPDEQRPGFKHFTVWPRPGGGLNWAKGTYRSVRGPITISWRINGNRFFLKVLVPPNTTASVHLPAIDAVSVTESGEPLLRARGVKVLSTQAGTTTLEVESGEYEFTATTHDH